MTWGVSSTAVETLLERGFAPSRTILLAFGVDEERGGYTVRQVLSLSFLPY